MKDNVSIERKRAEEHLLQPASKERVLESFARHLVCFEAMQSNDAFPAEK